MNSSIAHTQLKRFLIVLAWPLCMAGMTGCTTVGPAYTPPSPTKHDQFYAPLPHGGGIDNLKAWWNQFSDPLIAELISTAEENSPTLDQAIARIDQARANLANLRGGQLPTFTANAALMRVKGDINSPILNSKDTTTARAFGADASWELDLFGGQRKNVEAAEARLHARDAEWHASRVSLAAEVAGNLVNYRACQMIANVLQQDLSSRENTAKLTSLKIKAGFSAPSNQPLITASVADARQRLVEQLAKCDLIVKMLVVLTDLPEDKLRAKLVNKTQSTQPLPLPYPKEFTVNNVPAQVLSQRPDIASAERELAAASAEINVAEANRYPRLSLFGSIGNLQLESGNSNISTWWFGPSLSLPIFNGGRLKAAVNAAEARYKEANGRYRQAVRRAVYEIEEALVRLDAAARREQDAISAAQNYDKFFKLNEASFKGGNTNLLELEEVRRTALQARQIHIQVAHERVLAWIALYKALGGGWENNKST